MLPVNKCHGSGFGFENERKKVNMAWFSSLRSRKPHGPTMGTLEPRLRIAIPTLELSTEYGVDGGYQDGMFAHPAYSVLR